MNNTAELREAIRCMTGTFIADDLNFKSPACILNKMVRDSEIYVVGTTKGNHNRPVSVYKVGTLKTEKVIPKQRIQRVVKDVKLKEIPLYVQLWALVYPDLFTAPDFIGYKQSVRRVIGC